MNRGEDDPAALIGPLAARGSDGQAAAPSRTGSPAAAPRPAAPGSRVAGLALGTAQLGMAYGIANDAGQPDADEASRIIRSAVSKGLSLIDCARAYGEAEAVVGRALRPGLVGSVTVVTKLSPLSELEPGADRGAVVAQVDASIDASRHHLGLDRLPYLLLHRWSHRTAFSGAIWDRLRQSRDDGLIGRLGASVQDETEALEAIEDPDVGFIQVPFNIVDGRLQRARFPALARRRPDVMIQARSVFLQGLLILPPERWPPRFTRHARQITATLERLRAAFGRESIADLCVAHVRAQGWIDSCVIGVETLDQLSGNLRLFRKAPLSRTEREQVSDSFKAVPTDLLNPAQWVRPLPAS